MEDPSIIMPLLNSQVISIKANQRLAGFLTSDGSCFLMGKDFSSRPGNTFTVGANAELDLKQGIPQLLSMPERVTELALGENHLVMLSSGGTVYTAGSNEFGQLGVRNQRLPHFYEHPLTLERTYYTEKP